MTTAAAAVGAQPRGTRRPWTRGSTAGGKRRRSARRAAGITAAGLVVVLGGWSAVALTNPGEDQSAHKQDAGTDAQPQSDTRTLVPALQKGMKAADAIDSLKSAGLKPVQKDVFSTSVPAGAVIESHPKAGTPLPAHSAVTVTVSKGEQLFPVPDVSGKSESAAKSALEKAELAVGTVSSKHSSSVSKGDVISQSADAGKKLKKGAKVDLTVSKGPAPIAIPNVVGNSYGTAFGRLTHAGFRVAKEEVYSKSVPKGSVVSQYPRASAERQHDALVFLKVSKGKKPDEKKKDDKKADQKKADAKKKDAKAKKDADAKKKKK